jgi:hypothetical protein
LTFLTLAVPDRAAGASAVSPVLETTSGWTHPPAGTTVAEASAVPPLGWWDGILGNQARMIQVGVIVAAIAIFFLTRSHR